MKRITFIGTLVLLALVSCAEPNGGSVATSTSIPISVDELDEVLDYMLFAVPIMEDHYATLRLSADLASIDSTMKIFESFDAGAANVKLLFKYQDEVAYNTTLFGSRLAPRKAFVFSSHMADSLLTSKNALNALFSGYQLYAEHGGLTETGDAAAFAEARANALSGLILAVKSVKNAIDESARLSDEVNEELDRLGAPDLSDEQRYISRVGVITDRFSNHRDDYNDGLERIGLRVSSAKNQTEHRQALEEAVSHLELAQGWFRQDRQNFASVIPPSPFREFHLLMNSVLNDYAEATTSYVTYYSKNLNQGTRDLELANTASGLIRTANGNLQRAGYMYLELLEQR